MKDPVTVLADPTMNALIVGASPSDMKLVESLVASLDVPAPSRATCTGSSR